MGPAITIVIPFYSNKSFLPRAIESVRRQSIGDWTLVVLDDCGPHGDVKELVESYNDRRISYVRNSTNLGMAGNLNQGLSLAKTKLLTFLHDDDELLPNYLDLMLRAYESDNGAALYFCRAMIIDKDSRRAFSFPDFYKRFLTPSTETVYSLSGREGIESLMRGCFIMCPTVCYNLGQLGQIRFSERWKMVLDLDFYVQILSSGMRICGIRDIGYAYRRHASNQTAQFTKNMLRFEEESRLFDEVCSYARERGWDALATVSGRKMIIRLNLLFTASKDLLRFDFRSAWSRMVFLRNML